MRILAMFCSAIRLFDADLNNYFEIETAKRKKREKAREKRERQRTRERKKLRERKKD